MAKDVADIVGVALGRAARDVVQNVSKNVRDHSHKRHLRPFSGPGAVATGVGLVALAPLAGKGVSKLAGELSGDGAGSALKGVGERLAGGIKDALPDIGGSDDDESSQSGSQGVPGVGKGRRMPVQQDIDIGAPISAVYNHWTQFEQWPEFMHRVQQVSQEDPSHVIFSAKVWGISKQFTAEIVEQRPEERIKWRVTEGMIHNGVVTFHELAPRLTRVEVSLDIEPGSLLEKAARGMRHIKRAVRADMARFKAYVLMEEEDGDGWRGEIHEGKVRRRASSGGTQRSSSGRQRTRSASSRSRGSSSSASSSKRSGSGGRTSSGSRRGSGS